MKNGLLWQGMTLCYVYMLHMDTCVGKTQLSCSLNLIPILIQTLLQFSVKKTVAHFSSQKVQRNINSNIIYCKRRAIRYSTSI